MFLIDVKGLSAKNYWQISRKPPHLNLFYVLSLVPRGSLNEFFVLTQDEVNGLITTNFSQCRPEQQERGEKALRLGLTWGQAKVFADRWEILPR
jgi:hypothetical protein